MLCKIEEWPAFSVAGKSHSLKTADAFEIVPQIWQNAWHDGTMQRLLAFFPDYRPSGFLGIAAGGDWGRSKEMDYMLAVTNFVDVPDCRHVPAPDDMRELSFPAAAWAVVRADGDLPLAIQDAYRHFSSDWLPQSDYEPADLPVIECYMQDNRQELWISVVRRQGAQTL